MKVPLESMWHVGHLLHQELRWSANQASIDKLWHSNGLGDRTCAHRIGDCQVRMLVALLTASPDASYAAATHAIGNPRPKRFVRIRQCNYPRTRLRAADQDLVQVAVAWQQLSPLTSPDPADIAAPSKHVGLSICFSDTEACKACR